MDIGGNLRKIRDSKNITQQEVADYIGVERKTYVNWETGVSEIKSKYIPKLAEFFNVEIKDLFREKSSNIIINNTDNKEHSINNGIIILLNDKESMNELVNIIRSKFDDSKID